MIKVNLLDSVTDKQSGFAAVESRVTSPRGQWKLLLLVVAPLTVGAMFFDWSTARSAKAAAQSQLEEQQRIAAQMELVKKEQAELEKQGRAINPYAALAELYAEQETDAQPGKRRGRKSGR